MHFTIGSISGSAVGKTDFDLSHEIALLKTALLYGDDVELFSVGASVYTTFNEIQTKNDVEIAKLLVKYPGWLEPGKVDLLSKFAHSREWRRNLKRSRPRVYSALVSVLKEGKAAMTKIVNESTTAYNAQGLDEALNSKRLTLHRFQHTTVDGILSAADQGDAWSLSSAVNDLVKEYSGKTLETLSSKTYPVFDPEISNVIAQLVDAELVLPTPSTVTRGKHGGLASYLLMRLPSFELAPMDAVLDIRQDLDKPLRNFRTAVADYSQEIATESWTPDFYSEAERIFEERVKDSVDEIEEETRSNNSILTFLKRASATAATGTFSAFVAKPESLPAIAALLWGVGSLPVAESLRRKKDTEIRKNQLYFYYGVQRALAN
jgi:hypothetical protein